MSFQIKLLVSLISILLFAQNLLVKASDLIIESSSLQHCSSLHKLESLIKASSVELHQISEGKFYFDSVKILVSSSLYRNCLMTQNISLLSYNNNKNTPDVILFSESESSFFGNPIQSILYGECGVPGKFIRLASSALFDNSLSSLEFLKEWISYTFGVFREKGVENDPLYPLYTQEGPEILCHDACNLTQSHEIFCSPNATYNRDVVTKQNILCNGVSIWEMMMMGKTKDYKNKNYKAPTFSYYTNTAKAFVLLLDRSQASVWNTLVQSLFPFIARLPLGASLSIISYGSKATLHLAPTVITEKNREGLHGRIPRRPLFEFEDSVCVLCALQLGNELSFNGQHGKMSPFFILVSSSSDYSQSLHSDEERLLFSDFEDKGISVLTLDLSVSSFGLEKLSKDHWVVKPNLASLSLALSSVLRQVTNVPESQVFHLASLDSNKGNESLAGHFFVEESLRYNVWILVLTNDERDIEVFEICSPSGLIHSFPSFASGLAYFNNKDALETGIWSYSLKLYEELSTVSLLVMGESQNNKGANENSDSSIILNGWTEISSSAISIYAQITTRNDFPISHADVTAEVFSPNSSSPFTLSLRDNGRGYPDISEGDGIYSAYYTGPMKIGGNYGVRLLVSHGGGKARYPKALLYTSKERERGFEALSSSSSSSSYSSSFSSTIPSHSFTRILSLPSFFVDIEKKSSFYSVSSNSSDVFPPSRITDFSLVNQTFNSLVAHLTWTSPGGNLDSGTAFRYEIRCYTSREALRDDNFSEMSIPVHDTLVPRPEVYGTKQGTTVGVPWANEVFYYGIVAYDEAGNRGIISNVIAVYIREEELEVQTSLFSSSSSNSSSSSSSTTKEEEEESETKKEKKSFHLSHLGIVLLSLGLLTLISLLFFLTFRLFYCLSRQRERSKSALHLESVSTLSATIKKLLISLPQERQVWKENCSEGQVPSFQRALGPQSRVVNIGKTSPSNHTQSTELSSDDSENCLILPPRISLLEDYSVYRDLSNLSTKSMYHPFPLLPPELEKCHVISVPPYYEVLSVRNQVKKSRHESLV